MNGSPESILPHLGYGRTLRSIVNVARFTQCFLTSPEGYAITRRALLGLTWGPFHETFVCDFHRQMLKATEIVASDWLQANLLVKITDKMLHETLPRMYMYRKCTSWQS